MKHHHPTAKKGEGEMVSRVIVGILVFLMILMGGLGAYSYTVLNRQINDLGRQLTGF